jgi:hypothetical protein
VGIVEEQDLSELSGSSKGHDGASLQYSCVFVGCHLRRKVVEFAASHEAVNRRVGASPIGSCAIPHSRAVGF